MTDWPKYRSHKIVQATPIVGISNTHELWVDPQKVGIWEPFLTTVPSMAAQARTGDYAVIYEDGYCSVSPKSVFEKGYTQL